jgi:hypothetical protein
MFIPTDESRGALWLFVVVPLSILFLCQFLAATAVAGFPLWARVAWAVLTFVPLVGILVIMVVDRRLYDIVAEPRPEPTRDRPRVYPLAYWSIIATPLVGLGLPLGIVALVQIRRSGGALRGSWLAWLGVVLNSAYWVLLAMRL